MDKYIEIYRRAFQDVSRDSYSELVTTVNRLNTHFADKRLPYIVEILHPMEKVFDPFTTSTFYSMAEYEYILINSQTRDIEERYTSPVVAFAKCHELNDEYKGPVTNKRRGEELGMNEKNKGDERGIRLPNQTELEEMRKLVKNAVYGQTEVPNQITLEITDQRQLERIKAQLASLPQEGSITAVPDRYELIPLKQRFEQEYVAKSPNVKAIVIAVQKPWGGVEFITKMDHIRREFEYLAEKYDDDFCMKGNKDVRIINFMIV